MKLKQKLAVLLASTLLATSIPVVAYGATLNDIRITRQVTVATDTKLTENTAPSLVVETEDSKDGDVFYLELTNAKWIAAKDTVLTGVTGAEVLIINETEAKVTLKDLAANDYTVRIPLVTEVNGVAKVSTIEGSACVLEKTETFATTLAADNTFTVKTGTLPTVYDVGEIADVILTEKLTSSTVGRTEADRTVTMTLNQSDYEFKLTTTGMLNVTYSYGFAKTTTPIKAVYTDSYQDAISFVLPEIAGDSKGVITIQGLQVKATTRRPSDDVLTIDVEGKLIDTAENVKVANVSEYGLTFTSEINKETVYAGQQGVINFKLDSATDTLVPGRELLFNLDKGYLAVVPEKATKTEALALLKASFQSINVVQNTRKDSVNKTLAFADVITDVETKVVDNVTYVTGFYFEVPADKGAFEFKLKPTFTLADFGDVYVAAEGRDLPKDMEVKVAKVTEAISIKVDSPILKVGQSKQVGGSLEISELAPAVFNKNGNIEVVFDLDNGIKFTELPKVEVSAGDAELGTPTLEKGVLIIPLKRASRKVASTIKISNISLTVDRTVPEGTFDALIKGEALMYKTNPAVRVADFLKVGTKNTEDIAQGDRSEGLASSVVKFTLNSTTYTVNDTPYTMSAAPFVTAKGYTMVPIRYLATALGIAEEDILYDKGLVTFFYGNNVVQLTTNVPGITLNGLSIPMEEASINQNGRVYVPVGSIAKVLGIQVDWDNTTKVATFKK